MKGDSKIYCVKWADVRKRNVKRELAVRYLYFINLFVSDKWRWSLVNVDVCGLW